SQTTNAVAFTGQISGQGGFTITSSGFGTGSPSTGPIIFSGPNTFSGGIVVLGGSNGQNAAGVPTTLAIGSGATTILDSKAQLIAGPFGTGQLSFFNNQQNRNPTPNVISGSATTFLQTPDDGGSYVIGNHIYMNDETTFVVGATNPNTSLTLVQTASAGLD